MEHTYGWLKGRWWCLRSVADVLELVGACCTLHNICQAHGEAFNDTWLSCGCPAAPALCDNTDSSADGEIARRAIRHVHTCITRYSNTLFIGIAMVFVSHTH